jgi:hypothetical protein
MGAFSVSYTTPGYPAPAAPGPDSSPAGPAGMPPQPVQPQGGNGFAVASLIFGIIGGSIFGLIFGFIGLSRAAKVGKGKALSWVGIVLSTLWLIGQIAGGTYLATHISKATDPGCVAAKSLLLDEQKMNVSGPDALTALQNIVSELNDAASKAKNSAAHDSIKAVADDFQSLIDSVNKGTPPDSALLTKIEADGNAIDTACGTIGS